MEAGRWERIAEIYQSASELPPEQRGPFLAQACDGDADLRREVDSLLQQDVSREGPLERVARHVGKAWPHPGQIGRYRLLRLIGEGGMGAVYEAEQDHPRRAVALKLLKSPLAAPELSRRFELESEALGRLQHPGVARVYEAGIASTDFGEQPYFAMEFIRGPSLLEFAARERLGIRQRLELMARICEAVEHAHRRGIIHRDLKPANILVDETGQPKILDFGVALVTDADTGATRQTRLGDLIGTLAYMSPEQFAADPGMLDERSDVYSLGVILYELLAGRRPYDVGTQITAAARVVQEQEPARLGTIVPDCRGDVETIVAKALEKDKSRRYASAAELTADIARYLGHQVIRAKSPTALYRGRKFVRRHRALAGSAAAIFVVLIAGIVASTREAIRASAERDRALRAEQVATAVNDFLQNDVLAQAGSTAQAATRATPDPDLKVRTALDRAAARLAGKFDFQPVVEASIRRTIGLAYFDLSLYAESQEQLERAADLRRRALGANHPDTLTSLNELGVLYNLQGKYPAAEAMLAAVLEARRRVLGAGHRDTLSTMSDLGLAISYEGDDVRAAPIFAEVLAAQRRLLGDEQPDTVSVMDNLACAYLRLGRFSEAVGFLERELELDRRIFGSEHPSTINCMHNLATGYRALGRYQQADKLFLAAWEARRKTLGADHWETQNTRYSLAISYRGQRRYAEAEKLFRDSARILARDLGSEHPLTLKPLYHQAELYRRQHRETEAESLFLHVLEIRRRVLGPDTPGAAEVLSSLGELKLDEKAYGTAEKLLREADRIREKKIPNNWERWYTRCLLGASLAGQGKNVEARALLASGYEALVQRQSLIPEEYRFVLDRAAQWVSQAR